MNEQTTQKLNIINLGSEFSKFWNTAKDKSFEDQLKIWDEIIEQPNLDYYDGLVNGSEYDPEWKNRKTKRLQEAFTSYKTDFSELMVIFNNFNNTLVSQVTKYQKYFPDANFNVPIIAMPGASFNGKGGQTKKHELVLAFGVDIIHLLKGNTDILYSHELFHIYHLKKANITAKTFMETGKMTLPLYLEGLATFASLKINPNTQMSEVLMDDDLAKLEDKDIHFLAEEFLKIAENKAFDEKNPVPHRMWFGYKREKLKEDLPWRVGYLLGFKVIEKLEKKYSILEISSWSPDTANNQIISTLKEM